MYIYMDLSLCDSLCSVSCVTAPVCAVKRVQSSIYRVCRPTTPILLQSARDDTGKAAAAAFIDQQQHLQQQQLLESSFEAALLLLLLLRNIIRWYMTTRHARWRHLAAALSTRKLQFRAVQSASAAAYTRRSNRQSFSHE